jgi:hypothetical protein
MVVQSSLTMLFLYVAFVHLLFRKEAVAQQSGRLTGAITLAQPL